MRYIPEQALRALHAEVDGTCGLYISVPEAGEVLGINEHLPINAASTIKVPLLALLLKDGEDGRLDLDAPLPMDLKNRVPGSGVLKSLGNVTMSLWDYAVLMTIISDNSATDMVIDAVGVDRANAFFAEQGWKETHVAGKLYFPKPILPDGTEDIALVSAADLGNMMERMLEGTLVSPSVSRKMMQIMAAQQLGRFSPAMPVRRYANTREPLPEVPAEGGVIMCNKTGSLFNKVAHDTAAIILPDGKKATITVLTATKDNAKAEDIMKRMAAALYESLLKA
jgi:beta-lactamase class A